MLLSDVNQNVLTSQITVRGDGTIANIYLDHQISNINDQNSGTSLFMQYMMTEEHEP